MGVVDLLKGYPLHSVVTVQKLVALCQTMWVYIAGPQKIFGASAALSLSSGECSNIKSSLDGLLCGMWLSWSNGMDVLGPRSLS